MTDHGELSALRDRIRDLELALEQKTSDMDKLGGWYCDVLRQVGRDGARIQELECELEQAKARAVEWVSVEERLPEGGADVSEDDEFLIWDDMQIERANRILCGDGEWVWYGEMSINDSVTHWAPLPKPPEEVGG